MVIAVDVQAMHIHAITTSTLLLIIFQFYYRVVFKFPLHAHLVPILPIVSIIFIIIVEIPPF